MNINALPTKNGPLQHLHFHNLQHRNTPCQECIAHEECRIVDHPVFAVTMQPPDNDRTNGTCILLQECVAHPSPCSLHESQIVLTGHPRCSPSETLIHQWQIWQTNAK